MSRRKRRRGRQRGLISSSESRRDICLIFPEASRGEFRSVKWHPPGLKDLVTNQSSLTQKASIFPQGYYSLEIHSV